MAMEATLPLEHFIQAVQSQLDNAQTAMAVKARNLNLPLTFAIKDVTLDLIAAFQQTAIAELVKRTLQASEDLPVGSIIVSGGVAANSGLRKAFESASCPVYFPSLKLSTDNAAMIAAAAYPRLLEGSWEARENLDMRPQPSLALA